jgi:AraC-like DNA-binding protein
MRVFGFATLDLAANVPRVERTDRDVRLDGADHYVALFPLVGRVGMSHNGRTERLSAGDVALIDAAKPVTFVAEGACERWRVMSLHLPRPTLAPHLGFEPRGGVCRRSGTPAGHVLHEVIRGCGRTEGSALTATDSYMRLVVYDLLGALFAPCDPSPGSRHAEKLFTRIRALIEARLLDPDFGPAAVAAETGVSLRYVQKLFTARGSTCSEFIYALRLKHAARLLRRRAFLRSRQPLGEIAYASGFSDYTHFARRFRRRFGCAPGATRGSVPTDASARYGEADTGSPTTCAKPEDLEQVPIPREPDIP